MPRASTRATLHATSTFGRGTSSVALHPQVRFTSTHVTGMGDGHVHVSGELEAAGTRIPLAFDASVRMIDGELELEATTTVDQRRFGMSEGPLGNVRPPTTLHVKTVPRPRTADAGVAAVECGVAAAWQQRGTEFNRQFE